MKRHRFNIRTDCWRCRKTFGEPDIVGYIFGEPISFGVVLAYEHDDILCTDCMDEEEMNQIKEIKGGERE